MKQALTIERMAASAKAFCAQYGGVPQETLYGVTDGKAAGTFAGRLFEDCLSQRHDMASGNSAGGLGLPSANTGIEAASPAQPQSGCPCRDGKQKIYGLGCSLAVSVYGKNDGHTDKAGALDYCACSLVDSQRAADCQTAAGIRNIIANNGNEDDVFAFWVERNIPAGEASLMNMAKELLRTPPPVGCLTIYTLAFLDAKRVISKDMLMRISFQAVCGCLAPNRADAAHLRSKLSELRQEAVRKSSSQLKLFEIV